MKKFAYTLLFLLALSTAASAQAETVYRVGAQATVGKEQVVGNDLYISAGVFNRTNVSGQVDGDVYAAGSAIYLDGEIGADVFAVGGNVNVSGTTKDDVRIVGGDVFIDGEVGGDVFVIGGALTISDAAEVKGDVLLFVGEAKIEGNIAGSVFGTAEKIRLNSSVQGDVEVKVPGGLTLGDKADISGDIFYESKDDLVRSQNSVVAGEISKTTGNLPGAESFWRSFFTTFFILLFSVLTLFLLFKKQLQDMVEDIYVHPLITGGLGFSAVFAAPFVALLLVMTVLAAPLGLALVGLLIAFYSLSLALSGVTFGMYLSRWFFGVTDIELPVLIGGVFSLYLIYHLPYVGPLLFFAFYCISVGALVRFLVRKLS